MNERATCISETSSIATYIGRHACIYCGCAADASDRVRVASGGMVTALLATAIRMKFVDGVAVAKADFSQGKLGYRFDIVTCPDELRKYGTSAYFNIPIEQHWRELSSFDGRLAVCGLPCHTSILRRRRESGRGLANVEIFLSLFCGHNNEMELIRFVLEKEGISERDVVDMFVDRTYLGGRFCLQLRDGTRQQFPFQHFNVYRSLWFFAKPMCRYCDDHLGGDADISVGDIFLPEYRRRTIKHSVAIGRTDTGERLLRSAIDSQAITVEEIAPSLVLRAQKRILVPSADHGSRYHACRLMGFSGKRFKDGRFRLRSFLTYSLLLLNDRISRRRWGRKLLRWIPRPVLYAYIILIKTINNSLRAKS